MTAITSTPNNTVSRYAGLALGAGLLGACGEAAGLPHDAVGILVVLAAVFGASAFFLRKPS